MKFTYPFCYTPRPEIVAAARRLTARIDDSPELRALFAEGKMLGVLMVEAPPCHPERSEGPASASPCHPERSEGPGPLFLYAFSGLAGGRNHVEGFVPPIFDLLDPKGHFKQEEAAIVALNDEIRRLGETLNASAGTQDPPCHPERSEGPAPNPSTLQNRLAALKRERRDRSIALQEWIFDQFEVRNARGERLTIAEVFARRGLVPPSGTGECAAPKLLQYAYLHGLKPLALGEWWYGASPAGELRRAGSFYPACTGKCGPLLDFMLEGIDVDPDPLERTWHIEKKAIPIIYEDEAILVVDKPSGILSVPGRTNPVSVPALLREAHGVLYPCHRLDMDTSGLMVYAKTVEDQAALQRQFAGRTVRKSYRALLVPAQIADSVGPGSRDLSPGTHGWIDLPIAPDWYDRPRQYVDKEAGKHALTEYEILAENPDGTLEVRLTPHTGRTHQLRVHAAHPEGLGRPILGDRLYGGHTPSLCPTDSPHHPKSRCHPEPPCHPERSEGPTPLQLRADRLSFRHPRTGETLTFAL